MKKILIALSCIWLATPAMEFNASPQESYQDAVDEDARSDVAEGAGRRYASVSQVDPDVIRNQTRAWVRNELFQQPSRSQVAPEAPQDVFDPQGAARPEMSPVEKRLFNADCVRRLDEFYKGIPRSSGRPGTGIRGPVAPVIMSLPKEKEPVGCCLWKIWD